jgi:methylmalonyl-CoA mutase N-terminal domain/subunit
VRVAIQALAGVLGGTQSLHTNGYDEAMALPTEESARIALRTQQVLARESGVTRTVDPLGGSYYVEALTDEIERLAREYIEKIDEMGGAARAVEFMQEEIHQSAYRHQLDIESGTRTVVGVNAFTEEEARLQIQQPDYSELEARQCQRLGAWRSSRDDSDVSAHIEAIRSAARGTDNLMPLLVEGVRAGVTLGEVSHALRAEWGTYEVGS